MDVMKDLIAVGVLIFSLLFLLWMLRAAGKALKLAEAWLFCRTLWRRKPDDRIARIYIWQDGKVLVFNHSGQTLPELEGAYDQVRNGLLARLPEEVVFRWGDMNTTELSTITRQQFEQWQPGWQPPRAKVQLSRRASDRSGA